MKKVSVFRPAVILITLALVFLQFASAVSASSNRQVKTNRVIIRDIEALLEKEFHLNQPGGVVLIAHRDRVIFRRAYGLADLELGAPIRSGLDR